MECLLPFQREYKSKCNVSKKKSCNLSSRDWFFHIQIVPPMLSIPNQLEGAYVGQDVVLECHTEAYPASINYWTTERGDMIISGNERGDDECLLMRNFSFIICAHLQIPRGRAINLRQSPRIADIASIWNWKSETLVQMTLGIIAVWQKILSVCRNIMVVIREYWFLSFKFSRLFSLHRWNGWHDKTGWWARHMKN